MFFLTFTSPCRAIYFMMHHLGLGISKILSIIVMIFFMFFMLSFFFSFFFLLFFLFFLFLLNIYHIYHTFACCIFLSFLLLCFCLQCLQCACTFRNSMGISFIALICFRYTCHGFASLISSFTFNIIIRRWWIRTRWTRWCRLR